MGPLPASLRTTALLLAATLIGLAAATGDWGYSGPHGPSHWEGMCEYGDRQSPIDISDVETAEFETLFPLNYDKSYSASVTNNGHTVQFELKEPHSMVLVGGGLNRVFVFQQIHLHWPAEHTFQGDRPPLEAHFVHYDKALGNLNTAKGKERGLAVLGVLFKEDSQDNPQLNFLTIVDGLKYEAVKPLQLTPQHLLPRDTTSFFRYFGSLTTPGCDQVVLWTVLNDRVPISKKQLQYFSNITDAKGKTLKSNYRPVQNLDQRLVYSQMGPGSDVNYVGSANIPTNSILTLVISVVSLTVFAR